MIEITVPPAAYPVTLSEIKAQLRVLQDDDSEDDVIEACLHAAVDQVQNYVGHRLITQTVTLTLNGFRERIPLPVWPIQSITSIKYDDGSGVEVTLSADQYRLVVSQKPRLIVPAYSVTWPVVRDDWDSVRIALSVGYGDDGADVPPAIVNAIKLIAATNYEHRETQVVGAQVSDQWDAVVRSLLPIKFHPVDF